MKVSEVLEAIDLYKQDLSLYKTYYIKASGENAERLHTKYLEIKKMLNRVEEIFENSKTNVTEDDFKC